MPCINSVLISRVDLAITVVSTQQGKNQTLNIPRWLVVLRYGSDCTDWLHCFTDLLRIRTDWSILNDNDALIANIYLPRYDKIVEYTLNMFAYIRQIQSIFSLIKGQLRNNEKHFDHNSITDSSLMPLFSCRHYCVWKFSDPATNEWY